MSIESNKKVVRRYFEEAVDKRNPDILDELFTTDCVIHRPESPEAIVGLENFRRVFLGIVNTYSEISTAIHDLVAEEDRVAIRLSHEMMNRGVWTSRIGSHEVGGKPVGWSAIAIFRIHGGKIAEEWVCRDELGMLVQLGVLPSPSLQ